ncbi:MAG: CHAT domain-containing protein, partial [Thermoanaerobaculia bacterium]
FARVERSRGHLDLALQHTEEALEIIEALRRLPPGGDLRSAYFATKQNYYDFYVDLLMELADQRSDPEYAFRALTASERARARSQLEAVVESGSGPREDDRWIRRGEELRRSIASKQYQITRSVVEGGSRRRATELKREMRTLIDELDDVRGRIRQSNPLYAQITDPRPLTAEQIQQLVLDGDTLLLEYQLGEARSYLWAVTSEALEVFELPPQDDIEELVERGIMLLGASNREEYLYDMEVVLSELSDLLLAPVADLLDGQQLLIVAEGPLQYLPFAALPSPAAAGGGASRPLVADYEITGLPSASWLYFMRRQFRNREAPTRDVAVFADPVFRPAGGGESPELWASRDEAEAQIRAQQLPDRLYFTGLEADAILGLAENRQNLAALGFKALKERAVSGELRPYRYVHIATHGILDPEFPEQSSLVFSLYGPEGEPRDGFLLTHEIYQLDLLADLVVLSACQTAHGKRIRGEGLTGWTQGFMYSGAKRVIVSLWSVDDEATAELMKQFYTFLLQQKLSPATALRRAQNAIRQQPQWQAPYFWAPFILQGEYR